MHVHVHMYSIPAREEHPASRSSCCSTRSLVRVWVRVRVRVRVGVRVGVRVRVRVRVRAS